MGTATTNFGSNFENQLKNKMDKVYKTKTTKVDVNIRRNQGHIGYNFDFYNDLDGIESDYTSFGFTLTPFPSNCGGMICYEIGYDDDGSQTQQNKLMKIITYAIKQLSERDERWGIYYTTSAEQPELKAGLIASGWRLCNRRWMNYNSNNMINTFIINQREADY